MKFRFAALLVAVTTLCGVAVAADAASPTAGDDKILAARDAAKAGNRARLEKLVGEVRGHELEPYVEYWWLTSDLKNVDPGLIQRFLGRAGNTYLAERLRTDWLKFLGKEGRWSEFDAEYPQLQQPDQEVACYALQSRRLRGDVTANDDALPLWLSLIEPPESCYPVLEALIVDKRVVADDVWARIRRQFEANRSAAARYTMNYLPASQTPDPKLATAVIDAPLQWLVKQPLGAAPGRLSRELAALAISRIARNDPRQAADQLEKIEGRLKESERGWAWGQIGWQAALRHLPEAMRWFRKAGEAPLSDEVAQWKVRAALRAQDWDSVRATIERMPAELAGQPAWTYWLGRAYLAAGNEPKARMLFARLSGQPNFYGNLADDELGVAIVAPPRAAAASVEEVARMGAREDIRRSLALLRVGLRIEGVREWNWALRGFADRDLLAAAEVARRNGVYDRAIAAADRTKAEHDYGLRYLAPFSDDVRKAARDQALDDAWVYGLMRQESRFVTNAKSSAGASGLMQLMPATARWVARKIGLKDYHPGRVNDTEVNLLLGTTYMRLVLDSLDNQPVLASAAYNAGPGRARKWRADGPLEGAIYAETIPFTETRDYVKKVMSNAVYYALQFEGRSQSIKSRLGTIGARANGDAKGEDLP